MASNNIVGLIEIADLLEVGKRTPHAWAYRRLLPPPDFEPVNGLRAWHRSTILEWAARTGRLPDRLAHLIPAHLVVATTPATIAEREPQPVGVATATSPIISNPADVL